MMRQFFYPSSIAVFGVKDDPKNLAKNIIRNCDEMEFKGKIFPVGKKTGKVFGRTIITDPHALPDNIELAVILVPADSVPETLEICGRKGIRHAIVESGGFREFSSNENTAEKNVLAIAKQYGIRFIGPNCIGVICTNSGLCTPFSPLQPKNFKKGNVSLVCQSGGVSIQIAYHFSEEHVGFSKIISIGNKLDLGEADYIKYLLEDPETNQILLYLESIDQGRNLTQLAQKTNKPIIIYKSNIGSISSKVASSHTAALSSDDHIINAAFRQFGIIRADSIHDMTICSKALQLKPLTGDQLVVISLSGGFSVILGDTCEKYGFTCPQLPLALINDIERFRRGGVIQMSNPMDFGDVHNYEGLIFALEKCLALDSINGMALSLMYDPGMARLFGTENEAYDLILEFLSKISQQFNKPIALSFFAEKKYIDAFKKSDVFPVFNDPIESVRALRINRDYWKAKEKYR
jgi:acetate---CoA ligase (ADP-forming)